eukprot:TRINITY_DN966_c0_g1_i1.p1 TRINITY_DN966_c0_g1~~TRINITY_DN966_c0_g1_i1.p1  ORF type:complete len:447 (-),score=94.57 TRINITY_DN966_c0_g1_i1:97-1437(-)
MSNKNESFFDTLSSHILVYLFSLINESTSDTRYALTCKLFYRYFKTVQQNSAHISGTATPITPWGEGEDSEESDIYFDQFPEHVRTRMAERAKNGITTDPFTLFCLWERPTARKELALDKKETTSKALDKELRNRWRAFSNSKKRYWRGLTCEVERHFIEQKVKQEQDQQELMMALQSKLPKRPSKNLSVQWGGVQVRSFKREVGGSGGVPSTGSWSLGLSWDVLDESKYKTVVDFERRNEPDLPLTKNQKKKRRRQAKKKLNSSTDQDPDDSTNNDGENATEDKQVAAVDKVPRIKEQQREEMYRQLGLDDEEILEIEERILNEVRTGRQLQFCQCVAAHFNHNHNNNKRKGNNHDNKNKNNKNNKAAHKQEKKGICQSKHCRCNKAGAPCHVEGKYYCLCTLFNCGNPNGCYEFVSGPVNKARKKKLKELHEEQRRVEEVGAVP